MSGTEIRTSVEVALDAAERCETAGAGSDATERSVTLAYAAGVLRMLAAQQGDRTVTYRRTASRDRALGAATTKRDVMGVQ